MAFNPFIGWSQDELETELKRAQQDYAAGSSVESAGSGDVQSRNKIEISALKRIELLYVALNLVDPEKYPAAQISRVTQTRVIFGQSNYGNASITNVQ